MNDLIAAWRERIRAAVATQVPLRIVGGGSKDFYGQELIGERFDAAPYRGVVDYDPTELVITARCGTPLVEIEQTLTEAGQMLAFEPPHFGANATFGGCIAAGLSGPRRPYAGAVRDVVLGVRLLDGRGDELSFGGRVMKNVAGFDVSRLIAGSLGTLGVLLEASLKCLPLPQGETTVALEADYAEAMRRFEEWSRVALPLSATCWHGNRLVVRLSGASSAIADARRRIGGEEVREAETFWIDVREQRHPFFRQGGIGLWRCSVRATAPPPDFGGEPLVEWGGALRWFNAARDAEGAALRTWAQRHGGHATLFRAADRAPGVFPTLPPPLAALHQRLKSAFDPAGIFNPRRMYPEF
jgi:glycolate oxidase FAD binding subunit